VKKMLMRLLPEAVSLVIGLLAASGVAHAQMRLDVLAAFGPAGLQNPQAPLIQGTDGNFYGTTVSGGTFSAGTVFQLTPAGTLTVLYAFTGGTDGAGPVAGVIQAADGNFYGTTSQGGAANAGTVFQLTPAGALTVLYAFTGGSTDGATPYAGLIQATDGNFYGTTVNGGASSVGTVFQLTPAGAVSVLHAFAGGADGATPFAGLIQATDGSFYGTTANGGASSAGTVFQLTPAGAVSVLYAFTGETDGAAPVAGVIQATDGSFYGVTQSGGALGGGTAFRLRSAIPTTITWNPPAPIEYGTALSATQLDATASVPGTFAYMPPAGTVLQAGAGILNMAAAVNATAAAAPTELSFQVGDGNPNLSRSLTISNLGSSSTSFQLAAIARGGAPAPGLSLSAIDLNPGASAQIAVNFSASALGPGQYEGYILVADTSTGREAHVPYWYGVPSNTPAFITVLNANQGSVQTQSGQDSVLFRVIKAAFRHFGKNTEGSHKCRTRTTKIVRLP